MIFLQKASNEASADAILLKYRMVRVSADAADGQDKAGQGGQSSSNATGQTSPAIYKARIALDQQFLTAPTTGQRLNAGAGMQVAAEIHQGRRTVLEYLLSPVAKAVQEAGREK